MAPHSHYHQSFTALIAIALCLCLAPATAGADDDGAGEKGWVCDESKNDCRQNLEASIFLGSAIDTFAASDLKLYLNPEASGDTNAFERFAGALVFGYRLIGYPETRQEIDARLSSSRFSSRLAKATFERGAEKRGRGGDERPPGRGG